MDKQTAVEILTRYRLGNGTVNERRLVENWIVHGAGNPLDLSDAELLEDLIAIRLRLERDLRAELPARKISAYRRLLPYAAALLAIAFGINLYYFNSSNKPHHEIANITIDDIAPGGNKATLRMADGRIISLSSDQSGIIIGDDGILYSDGKTILEQGVGDDMAVLSIPKGGTYQIILADGTKVWLNSASTLKYPTRFTATERVVELEGEAYFEVARQQSVSETGQLTTTPFLVKTSGQVTEVLGTQFNIAAYSGEDKTFTTLVEGSVKVTPARSTEQGLTQGHHRPVILKPGTQSTVQNGHATVIEVDVSAFSGWKDGYFVFDGTELRDALKQLSRWYDVEITYEGLIPRTPLYGRISRADSLAQVLEIFKEGNLNFRIEKQGTMNRLIVMP